MADKLPGSALDRLIRPEIKHDRFARAIVQVAATDGVRHILEIGSSAGDGSTEAIVRGALQNRVRPTVHCLEVSKPRYAALCERYRDVDFVRCYNVSSVPLERFPSDADVTAFHRHVKSKLSRVRLELVLSWLRQDREYLMQHDLSAEGIRQIKEANGITQFDAVLIDGSEFTGRADLDEVYGARFLLLDDIRTYKNYHNAERLSVDPAYRLVKKGRWPRNGFAVFERSSNSRTPDLS